MPKIINNPKLLNLIGMKLHVRDIADLSDVSPEIREFMASSALNDDRYVHSVIFSADSPPEIGLVKDMSNPDDLEYYQSDSVLFSDPRGTLETLPVSLFTNEGSLTDLPNNMQPVPAQMAFRPSAQTLAIDFNN